jgi:hydroxymethylpyrimidine pyrophosphatase-like HAD family hydrolase
VRGTTGPGSARDALDRRYEALVFDWDGTAVPDRRADAGSLRAAIEELCELGMHLAIVSGTDLDTE